MLTTMPMLYTCQSSSMEFLASQGFDFNKVFKEGMSVLLLWKSIWAVNLKAHKVFTKCLG